MTEEPRFLSRFSAVREHSTGWCTPCPDAHSSSGFAVVVSLDDLARRYRFTCTEAVNGDLCGNERELVRMLGLTDGEIRLETDGRYDRGVDGATAMRESTDHVPAVWGDGDDVFWAQGEPLMLAGPDGIGKTTLGQQLALCRVGIRKKLLGYPVEPAAGKVLYIAADRPRQAIRSMRRMVVPADYELLEQRLVIWRGPLGDSLAANPRLLVDLADHYEASDVIIDSLKDLQPDLIKDESGSRVNIAMQELIATDRELLTLHHQRKAQPGASAPKHLSDVYGSRWLTAGQGSVLMLWGEPGDLVIELRHLKQPAGEIGPLQLIHDHGRGTTTVQDDVDLLALNRSR